MIISIKSLVGPLCNGSGAIRGRDAGLFGMKKRPALAKGFQIMVRTPRILLLGLLVAAFSIRAHAAATVSLYDGVNPLITVVDNGPGDLTGATGEILVQTNVGVWTLVISTAKTKPVFGSVTDPVMDLSIQATSIAAGSLRLVLSDNGFGPSSGFLIANVNGNRVVAGAAATVSYSVYGDPANVVGATTVLIASTGTMALPTIATASGPLGLGAPFSLTEVVQLIANGATSLNADASLNASDPLLTPASATNQVGTVHTICATVRDGFNVVAGTTVTFNITNGPNATVHGTSVTDSNGVACFTYVGTGGVGTDIIDVSFVPANGTRHANFATKLWVSAPNRPPVAVCTNVVVSANPTNCLATASIDGGSYDPDGDLITLSQVPPGPYPIGLNNVCLVVTDSHGASNTCCAVVFVVDTKPPVLNCPGNIVATNDPGQCSCCFGERA